MIHQVGPDGVVPIRGERDFHFSAYAIDARDQNWIVQAAKIRSEQSTKPADFSEHLWPMGLPNESLEAVLEPISKINIYARARISFFFLFCHVDRSEDISHYSPNISSLISIQRGFSRLVNSIFFARDHFLS